MRILIDMNLSPRWVEVLRASGHEARHWSEVGSANAEDAELMTWAATNGHIVVTNDLDFSAILAATNASGPSVLQVRAQGLSPRLLSTRLLAALTRFESHLAAGALVTIDERRERARILPLFTRRLRGTLEEPIS